MAAEFILQESAIVQNNMQQKRRAEKMDSDHGSERPSSAQIEIETAATALMEVCHVSPNPTLHIAVGLRCNCLWAFFLLGFKQAGTQIYEWKFLWGDTKVNEEVFPRLTTTACAGR